jgi:hypothetical protein
MIRDILTDLSALVALALFVAAILMWGAILGGN